MEWSGRLYLEDAIRETDRTICGGHRPATVTYLYSLSLLRDSISSSRGGSFQSLQGPIDVTIRQNRSTIT
jgi:hypothetical protein